MKIAFFNWRDIKNPSAGGAEVFVHNLMLHLVKKGHEVTLFTSGYPGSAEHGYIDGIEHIRYGNRYTIHAKPYLVYKKYVQGKYDAIVESINGIPFFIPMFSKEKSISYIHQLTGENWYSGLWFPLAFVFSCFESTFLSLYRKKAVLVPSKSTYDDLKKIGIRNIFIVPGAAQITPPKQIKKSKNKVLIYLGRLTKSKQVGHAIAAFAIFRETFSDAELWIVGSGPEEKKLKRMAPEGIRFFGFVDEKKKAELLSKAHALLFPGVREGWGLVVLEANCCGTPAIGYDVPGLRDSIRDGVNGYVVPSGDYKSMAQKAILLVQGDYDEISRSAIEYSKKFTWEKTASDVLKRLMD